MASMMKIAATGAMIMAMFIVRPILKVLLVMFVVLENNVQTVKVIVMDMMMEIMAVM